MKRGIEIRGGTHQNPQSFKVTTKLVFFLFLINIYFQVSTLFHQFLFARYVIGLQFYLFSVTVLSSPNLHFVFVLTFLIHHCLF